MGNISRPTGPAQDATPDGGPRAPTAPKTEDFV